jgi:RpiR family transcriptional regulator, carbohydrate utilization regulator
MPIKISEESAELIPHSCMVKLQAIYDTLKSAERKAADLLLENPKFLSEASIVEAAEAGGCSEATLVRLARKLGYGGYPELKAHLTQGRDNGPVTLYEGISDTDSFESVIGKVFQASIQALQDTLNIIDNNVYEKAIDAIANADKIVLCGVGDAANVALSGFQKLVRVGANVQASADPDIQLIAVSHLKKGDVIIAISHSGRTKSIVDLVKYSKVTGATVISITNYPVSPLAKNSDIVLLTAAFTEHVKGEVMSKRIAELCLLESLFVNVLLRKKDVYIEGLRKSNLALDINKI